MVDFCQGFFINILYTILGLMAPGSIAGHLYYKNMAIVQQNETQSGKYPPAFSRTIGLFPVKFPVVDFF